jgi:2,4-dienoyl-CoA reductase-like NADH-dependent reductase (Old Yellow Enzyme family)
MSNKIWDSPIFIGNNELRNRIIFPPIGTGWSNMDGTVSTEVLRWYKEIAQGGCGMIVVEGTAISPEGKGCKRNISLYNETHVAGLKSVARTIRDNNCFTSIQLLHAGGQANPEFTGYESISPSDISSEHTGTGHSSREMSLLEINEIRKKYIHSSKLASRSGFQAIELHLAHGYLLHQFLSEHTNKRKDHYGGNLENRTRLILEIITGIKEELPGIVLGARVSGEDYLEDGLNYKTNKNILPLLEQAGLDYFSVSAGIYETSKLKHQAMMKGEFFDYAKGIKQIVKKPVIGVGKILDLDSAEAHLKNNNCDLVAIGRGLVADPKMIIKTIRGEFFNKCTDCGQCRYLALGKENLTCPFRNFG